MGAGASAKGKSPGSAAPKIPTPPQIGQIGANTQNIGQYESQFLNEPWSLGNWAMNIATGGTGPQVTQNLSEGTQTGLFGPQGAPAGVQSSVVQTYGSGGGSGGYGGSGGNTGYGGGSNVIPAATPQGGAPNVPAFMSTPGAGAGGWGRSGAKATAGGGPPANAINPFGGGGAGGFSEGNLPGILGGFSAGENAAWNTANSPYPGTSPGAFSAAYGDIAKSQRGIQKDINQFGPNWLTPQQNAMINQQTAANKAAIAQTEGSMGLSGSTQAAQLAGEMGLAGTAAKGQLQQQNMQLVQGWQKLMQSGQALTQGEQGLALGAQQQAFNQFQQFAQLNASEQAQMFTEGTAGYQLMQTFMSSVLQPYGISLQAFNDILQANTAQIGDQVALQSTAISADQSGQNQVVGGLFQALSSLLGGLGKTA